MTRPNTIASSYDAPIINLCGVRVGSDKLTHMLGDGLRKFLSWTSGSSLDQIYSQSLRAEFEFMGARSASTSAGLATSVDIPGARLYHDLIFGKKPLLCRDSNSGKLNIQRNVDICNYVTENFDERVMRNYFTGERTNDLFRVIKNREKGSKEQMDPVVQEHILSREGIWNIPARLKFEGLYALIFKQSRVPKFLENVPYLGPMRYFAEPENKVTRKIHLCRSGENTEPSRVEGDEQFMLTEQSAELYRMFELHRWAMDLIGPDGTLSGPAVEELKGRKIFVQPTMGFGSFDSDNSQEISKKNAEGGVAK